MKGCPLRQWPALGRNVHEIEPLTPALFLDSCEFKTAAAPRKTLGDSQCTCQGADFFRLVRVIDHSVLDLSSIHSFEQFSGRVWGVPELVAGGSYSSLLSASTAKRARSRKLR